VIRVADGSSFTVWADSTLANLQTQVLDRVPAGTTVKLEPGTYYVPTSLKVPKGVQVQYNGAQIVVGTAADTEAELRAALADSSIDTIYVRGTIPLSSTLKITRPIRITGTGSGATITRADNWTVIGDPTSKGNAMLISVENVAGEVVLENLTVSGAQHRDMGGGKTDYGSGINIYQSGNVTLKDVASIGNAGAGVIVNGSVVVASGLTTSGNGWYGVGVNKGSGVTESPSFTVDASSQLGEDFAIVALESSEVNAPGYDIYPHPNEPGNVVYSKKALDLEAVNAAYSLADFSIVIQLYRETLGLSQTSLDQFNQMPAGQGRQQAVWSAVRVFVHYESKEDFRTVFEYVVDKEYTKMLFIQAVDGAANENAMKEALEQYVPVLYAKRLDLIGRLNEIGQNDLAGVLESSNYTLALAGVNDMIDNMIDNEEDLTGLAAYLLDERNNRTSKQFFGVEAITDAIKAYLDDDEAEDEEEVEDEDEAEAEAEVE